MTLANLPAAASVPVLHVDPRGGSCNLPPYLKALGAVVDPAGQIPTDIEWLGNTALGPFTPIGAEHKSVSTGDIFTSMTNGRLTGEQLPKMLRAYPAVRYVIVEGATRRSRDGRLEIMRQGQWDQAYSRNGTGWTWDEWRNRIESIEEFWSEPHVPGRTRVVETYDVYASAAFLVGRWHYWNRPYESHSSARQWDTSQRIRRDVDPLSPSRSDEVPLVQLWAADIDGIGTKRSAFVARHFKTARALANATEEDWADVEYKIQRRDRSLAIQHFGKDTIRKILTQINTEKG